GHRFLFRGAFLLRHRLPGSHLLFRGRLFLHCHFLLRRRFLLRDWLFLRHRLTRLRLGLGGRLLAGDLFLAHRLVGGGLFLASRRLHGRWLFLLHGLLVRRAFPCRRLFFRCRFCVCLLLASRGSRLDLWRCLGL